MAYSKRQAGLAFDSCRTRRQPVKAKVGRLRSMAQPSSGSNKKRRVPSKLELTYR